MKVMDVYSEIVKLREAGRRGALATIINVRGSIPSFETAKMLVRDDGTIVGTVGGGCVEADVWQAAKEVMQSEKPRTMTFDLNQNPKDDTGLVCGGTLEVFIEPVLPVPQLFLFGAGHVAQNVYRAAKLAGFDVTVVDDREAYANRERFPDATAIVAADFEQAFGQISTTDSSFIVIVTRGHKDDMRILRWAVDTPHIYLGMIGSERKFISVQKELQSEGVSRDRLEHVYSPVGLDIGRSRQRRCSRRSRAFRPTAIRFRCCTRAASCAIGRFSSNLARRPPRSTTTSPPARRNTPSSPRKSSTNRELASLS